MLLLVPVVEEDVVEHEVVDAVVVLEVEVVVEVEFELAEVVVEVEFELAEVVVLLLLDEVVKVVLFVELEVEFVVGVVDVVVGVVDDVVLLEVGIELEEVVKAELDVFTEAGFVSRKYAPTPAITTMMITIAAMTLDAIPRFTNIMRTLHLAYLSQAEHSSISFCSSLPSERLK